MLDLWLDSVDDYNAPTHFLNYPAIGVSILRSGQL